MRLTRLVSIQNSKECVVGDCFSYKLWICLTCIEMHSPKGRSNRVWKANTLRLMGLSLFAT